MIEKRACGFLLYLRNMEDNVVMPQAVLGHQKKLAKERLTVMFHFSLPSPMCVLSVSHVFYCPLS